MVKILVDNGMGQIEVLTKNDFSRKETIGDVMNSFSKSLYSDAFEILECKYEGDDIPMDFELKPVHKEIRVRLKSYQIELRYKFRQSNISWSGTVQCAVTEYLTGILHRKVRENGHATSFNIRSLDCVTGRESAVVQAGAVYSAIIVNTSMVTFEFTHNGEKQAMKLNAADDDRVYRLAYISLQQKVSTLEFDVHVFIADTKKGNGKLEKIAPFAKVTPGQTYRIFFTPAYHPTSPTEDKKTPTEKPSIEKRLAEGVTADEMRVTQKKRNVHFSQLPSGEHWAKLDATKRRLNQMMASMDSETPQSCSQGLEKNSAQRRGNSSKFLKMAKKFEAARASTGPIGPAVMDSKRQRSGTEVIATSHKEMPNTLEQKLSEFVKKLTVKMNDDNSRQVETFKSMIGQIFRPEETEEYKKLKADYTQLRKVLDSTTKEFTEGLAKLSNQMHTQKEADQKFYAAIEKDWRLSQYYLKVDQQTIQDYKQRLDEEIERNVKANLRLKDMTEEIHRLQCQINTIANGRGTAEKLEESSTNGSFEALDKSQFQVSDDSPAF